MIAAQTNKLAWNFAYMIINALQYPLIYHILYIVYGNTNQNHT